MQVAARYGSTPVPQSLLTLASGQPSVTGTGALQWIEVFNEVNNLNWGVSRNEFFSPYEYAAMLSAAYDGHGGALGAGYGARTADPSIKVAMSGLQSTGPSAMLDYIKAINYWAQGHRPNGDFPAQAINVHLWVTLQVFIMSPNLIFNLLLHLLQLLPKRWRVWRYFA